MWQCIVDKIMENAIKEEISKHDNPSKPARKLTVI